MPETTSGISTISVRKSINKQKQKKKRKRKHKIILQSQKNHLVSETKYQPMNVLPSRLHPPAYISLIQSLVFKPP